MYSAFKLLSETDEIPDPDIRKLRQSLPHDFVVEQRSDGIYAALNPRMRKILGASL